MRQVGKTTLAQSVLSSARTFNYDLAQDARIILKGAESVAEAAMDGEQNGIDVMGYKGQSIKVSARDFLGRLI